MAFCGCMRKENLGTNPLGGCVTNGEKGKRETGLLSPYLFNIRFCDVDVSIHFLKVLLRPVSLLAIPLKSPLALEAEESGGGERGD